MVVTKGPHIRKLPRRVVQGNTLVVAAMSVGWLVPMLQYWGAVFGPLRPFAYDQVPLAPSWAMFLLVGVACALPATAPLAWFDRASAPRSMRMFERVGIRRFRALATNGDCVLQAARREDPRYRVLHDASAVATFLRGTAEGERAHLVLLLVGVATAVHATRIGWYGYAVGLTLGNVVFNAYPILLQRYNRTRLHAVQCRLPGGRGASLNSREDR